jgi:ribonuclease BN (tRNA processing enzyme)
LHEAWLTKEEADKLKGSTARHSVIEDVLNFAMTNNVQSLFLIHLNPSWTENKLKLIETK